VVSYLLDCFEANKKGRYLKMTTQEKLIRNKLSLLELAEYLKNVSEACKINGVSRQHFMTSRKHTRKEVWKVFVKRAAESPA
jgi:hypothetical protein